MFYMDVLKRLKQRINCVRSEIKDSWKLHHDNAPSHTAFVVRDYLTRIRVATVQQPPTVPTIDNIKTTSKRLLKGIPVEDLQGVYTHGYLAGRNVLTQEGHTLKSFRRVYQSDQ